MLRAREMFVSILLLITAARACADSDDRRLGTGPGPIVIRVGIVANESEMRDRVAKYYDRFAELERICDGLHKKDPQSPQFHFRLAFGGYTDLYYWAETNRIDLGIFSPGVYAAVQRGGSSRRQEPGQRLAHWIELGVETEGAEDGYYEARCVVPASFGASVDSIDQLVSHIKSRGDTELLFTDYLSLSGFIAPLVAFRQPGVALEWKDLSDHAVFVFSHDRPLQLVAAANGGTRLCAAFVRQGELYRDIDPDGHPRTRKFEQCPELFHTVKFPPLDELKLPPSLVAVNSDVSQQLLIQSLLRQYSNWFRVLPSGQTAPERAQVVNWLNQKVFDEQEREKVSLREI